MDNKTRLLIGVGVAAATGATTLLEEYIQKAKDSGVSFDEFTEVFNIVRVARLSSSIAIDSFVEKRIQSQQKIKLKIFTPSGAACDCGPEGCC